MFDWEAFWMETIISAVIASVGAIVVGLIGYFAVVKNSFSKLANDLEKLKRKIGNTDNSSLSAKIGGTDNGSLSAQHQDMKNS